MLNMCNAISTPCNETRRKISGWRIFGVLVLLIALLYSSWRVYQRAVFAYLPQLSAAKLVIACTIAEEVEDERAEGKPLDIALFHQVVSPLFQSEPSLAAVRLWTPYQQLTCEITRPDPQISRTSDDAVLPNLQAHEAMLTLRDRLADADWLDTVSQIQLLQNEQSDISDALSQAGPGEQKMLRVQLTDQQNAVLTAAQTQDSTQHLLGETVHHMNAVLDALTLDEGGVSTALDASHKVEDDLSAALGQYRSVVSATTALPKEFAALAPTPTSRVTRLLPMVSGQRVIMPLFIADANDQLTTAGYAEEIFYLHPADALSTLGWKQYRLPASLLLLLLMLLCWPRRKR